MHSACSATGLPPATSTTHLSGTTCAPSTGSPGVDVWISSLRATRARARVTPAYDAAATIRDGCGPTYGESFAKWTPDGWQSRTSQLTLAGLGPSLLPTWPRAGGVSNGIACQRRPLAPRTSAIEYSLSLHRQWLRSLGLDTLIPTPTATDAKMSGSARYSTASGRHSGTTLTDALCRDASGLSTGRLNPCFVEWMQAFPEHWTVAVPHRHRLRLLGNAVVWPAAAKAYSALWARLGAM